MAALYSSAALIVEKVLNKQGTVKSLAINSRYARKKKLYALVCETLKYKGVIDEILEQSMLLKLEKKLKYNYSLVLVYDFLFGPGLQCGTDLKQCILKHKSTLQSSLARLKIKAKVHRNQDLLPQEVRETASLPRYVRINRIKTTFLDVVRHFKESGYEMIESEELSAFITKSKQTPSKRLMCDKHLPDILVFPPGTDLHDHPLYVSGRILLQDKASCFPAHVLAPPPGSCVIDACAAPGNKSSHVASLMNNQGKIFAFDIDSKRLTVMQKLMRTAGVDCVTTNNCSFLDVDPLHESYSNVQYIIVDPSCSGSGIASRMDSLVNKDEDVKEKQQRLESLAKFQLSVLNHALSFPAVKRVVYSTCSIHQQENEDVVKAALNENVARFSLEKSLPSWPHRGLAVFPGAEQCIRASPLEDHTNGFFVALFVRKENAIEQNAKRNGTNPLTLPSRVPSSKKRKEAEKAWGQVSSSVSEDVSVASIEGSSSSSKKRRKRNNKRKAVDVKPEESQNKFAEISVVNSAKKKRIRKKKRNKVSVCS